MAFSSAGVERANWPARCAEASLMLAGAAVPLAIAPGVVLESDVTPKLVILLGAAALLLLCGHASWNGVLSLLRTGRGRIFALLLAVQVISLMASTLASPQPGLSLAGAPWRRYGLITQLALVVVGFFGAAFTLGRPRTLRRILLAMVGSSAGIAVYALCQFVGWDPWIPPRLYTGDYNGAVVRVPGTLGHAVYLGSFLAAILPLMLGLLGEVSEKLRVPLRVAAVVCFTVILISGSRSAVIALAVAGLVWLGSGARVARATVWKGAAIGAVVISGLALWIMLPPGASLRRRTLEWRFDYLGGTRLPVWRDALSMIPSRSLVGYGPETFASQFRQKESAALARAYPDYVNESPHNLLIDLAFSQGFPGVLVPLGLVFLLFWPTPAPLQAAAAALRISFLAGFLSLLFLSVTIPGGVMLYLTAALYIGASTPRANLPAGRYPAPVQVSACLLAILLLAGAYLYGMQDHAYERLERPGVDLDGAVDAYGSATRFGFPAAGDDLWCSRQFAKLAVGLQADQALRGWRAAYESSLRAEAAGDNQADAAYQSAVVAISVNDAATAEHKLRAAVAAAPTWYKPHLLLAQLLQVTGRQKESEPEARLAVDLAGRLTPDVKKALRVN